MGADGQPQIQLQCYVAMIDFGLGIQEALEMPRFLSGRFGLDEARDTLHVESRLPAVTISQLETLGHVIDPMAPRLGIDNLDLRTCGDPSSDRGRESTLVVSMLPNAARMERNVRFGSQADMRSRRGYVRFGLIADLPTVKCTLETGVVAEDRSNGALGPPAALE